MGGIGYPKEIPGLVKGFEKTIIALDLGGVFLNSHGKIILAHVSKLFM